MSELLTTADLAQLLKVAPSTVQNYTRSGRIKPDFFIGTSPRYDLEKVCKQLAKAKPTGNVPTL